MGQNGRMAVYTEVGDDELRGVVALYDIGEVLSCKGIAEGVENSNFLLTTERGNFILTLYEKRVAREDLPFFIALMDHLAHQGVACPTPVRARDGEALSELCGRPAAIVTFLNGMWPRRIEPSHCAGARRRTGALHLAGGSFRWCGPTTSAWPAGAGSIEAAAARADEMQAGPGGRARPTSSLPRRRPGRAICRPGSSMPICFPTTSSSRPRAVRADRLLLRLHRFPRLRIAICLNAWCFEPDGSFNVTKARLLVRQYRAVAAARRGGTRRVAAAGARQRAALSADPAV